MTSPTADASIEEGMTLPDVLIGLAIVGVLTMATVRSLIGIGAFVASGDRAADARQDVERAADHLLVDVAGAESVVGDLAPATYDDELHLVIDEAAGHHIVWRRDVSGDLTRQEWTGASMTATATYLFATPDPPFVYHDATGAEIDPVADGPALIGACTTRVRATLATARAGTAAATAVVDAPLTIGSPSASCP